jgi:hypothetical protein
LAYKLIEDSSIKSSDIKVALYSFVSALNDFGGSMLIEAGNATKVKKMGEFLRKR